MFNDNKQAVYIDQRFGWMDEFEFDLYFGDGEFQRIITGDHPGELEKKKTRN